MTGINPILFYTLWSIPCIIILGVLCEFFGYVIWDIKKKSLKNCPYEHYVIYQVGLFHYSVKLRCKVLFFWTWLWLRDTKTREKTIFRGDDFRLVMKNIREFMDSRQKEFILHDKDRYRYSQPRKIYTR